MNCWPWLVGCVSCGVFFLNTCTTAVQRFRCGANGRAHKYARKCGDFVAFFGQHILMVSRELATVEYLRGAIPAANKHVYTCFLPNGNCCGLVVKNIGSNVFCPVGLFYLRCDECIFVHPCARWCVYRILVPRLLNHELYYYYSPSCPIPGNDHRT